MRNLYAFGAGGLFGIGLWLSGMTDTRKVIGWLDAGRHAGGTADPGAS